MGRNLISMRFDPFRPFRNAIFLVGLIFCFSSMQGTSPNNDMDKDILYYVNVDRKSIGLKPLELNSFESSVAAEHSRNMASGKTPFGHKGMDARIKKIGKELGALSQAG